MTAKRPTERSVQALAQCQHCPWTSDNPANALATAARHADATTHEVHTSVLVDVVYNRAAALPGQLALAVGE